jgi:hypothetical protein
MNENPGKKTGEVRGAVHLELSVDKPLDPGELIEEYNGQLVLHGGRGSYTVGEGHYYVVRVNEMMDQGISPFMEMEALCQDTCDFCPLLTETEGADRWTRVVYGAFPEVEFGELLLLNRVVVNPPFRGKKLGLHFVELVLRITGGMRLVALRPDPVWTEAGCDKEPAGAGSDWEKRKARGKLMGYFSRLGFKVLWGDDFMVLDPREMRSAKAGADWKDKGGQASFRWTEEVEKYRLADTKA